MDKENLKKKTARFPNLPGVYLMKGNGGKIIYIGKAKNLRARVNHYFQKEAHTRYQIEFLIKRVAAIDFFITHNEKEATLLENSLIKKHKPRYNIFLKDDKTYVSLKLGLNHPYPDLSITRKIKKDGALYFGPYASAHALRETVDFIYRNFRLRTCSDHEINNRSRPCLEFQINRCTAPCVGLVSREEYADQVDQVRLFLTGKSDDLREKIEKKMSLAAETEQFESAARLRDLLRHIEATLEKQKVVRHFGAHQDFISMVHEGNKALVFLLSIRDGVMIDSRYYPVDYLETEETLLEQFISQYYLMKDVFIPDEILTSQPLLNGTPLIELLSEKKGKKVVLRPPLKGEKKELIEMAQKNAASQFARIIHHEYQTRDALTRLQSALGLPKKLKRMECYDISAISGKMAAGSRVVFIDGCPDKKEYRQYKIGRQTEPNDYAMLKEVFERRFSHQEETTLPDLIVVDGGKGQLKATLKVLEEKALSSIPLVAIAKGSGPGARAKGLWDGKKEEEIYLPNRKNPLILKRGAPELMLLQRIRDEAHRFAIKYHRKLRESL